MKYEIKGNPFPVVELQMRSGEHIITDSGAMAWMDPGIDMETISKGGAGGVSFSYFEIISFK